MTSVLTKKEKKLLGKILMGRVEESADVAAIIALLHAGANPGYRDRSVDPEGITPLMAAARNFYTPAESATLVTAFKTAGADLFAADSRGRTAADHAGYQHNETLELALRREMKTKKFESHVKDRKKTLKEAHKKASRKKSSAAIAAERRAKAMSKTWNYDFISPW
jgi:hypothetical protein